MFWIIVAIIFGLRFIHYVFFKEDNDESTTKDLNINHNWRRNEFDPDTYIPSSLHGDKYDEDE